MGTKRSLLCKFLPQAAGSQLCTGPRWLHLLRPAHWLAGATPAARQEGAGLLELRGCGAPPRAPWAPGEGGRRRHGSGIWPCFCPWPCHKAEKERGLHTEGFAFLLLGKHSPEHGISETSGPSRGQGPRCAEFPGSSLPTSLRSPPLSSAPTAERGGGGAVLGGRISTYDFWRGHKHSDCSKSTYYVPGNLCDTEDMAVLT